VGADHLCAGDRHRPPERDRAAARTSRATSRAGRPVATPKASASRTELTFCGTGSGQQPPERLAVAGVPDHLAEGVVGDAGERVQRLAASPG
jgi:hypothetical protein